MKRIDITMEIGQLGTDCEWPMYSYNRPAYMLWNSIANALHKKGWTEPKIKAWLQSKNPRWALDGSLGDELEALGKKYAAKIYLGHVY